MHQTLTTVTRSLWVLLAATPFGCSANDEGLYGPDPGTTPAGLGELVLATRAPHCDDEGGPPAGFTEQEWQRLSGLSPLPEVPADTTNAYADSSRARKLGQELFCDPGFSGALLVDSDLGHIGDVGRVSCASCHSGPSLDDRRSEPGDVSIGTGLHTRNAPGIVNSSFYAWTNWGGRFSAQWELPMPVVENAIIMNSTRLEVVHRIMDEYERPYERIFGALEPAIATDPARFPPKGKPKAAGAADGPWELMAAADRDTVNRVFVNYGKALAAYFRVLVSGKSDFDDFMAGKRSALSQAEQRGARLFVGKARCGSCHNGPHFSDGEFHNLGIDATTESDTGRFRDAPGLLTSSLSAAGVYSDDPAEGLARQTGLTNPMPEATRGAFRTASLRGVEFTEPYMHTGRFPTLEAVVDFYDAGGGTPAAGMGTKDARLAPLGLTPKEKRDLVAFLHSLSGKPIPERLLCDDYDYGY